MRQTKSTITMLIRQYSAILQHAAKLFLQPPPYTLKLNISQDL